MNSIHTYSNTNSTEKIDEFESHDLLKAKDGMTSIFLKDDVIKHINKRINHAANQRLYNKKHKSEIKAYVAENNAKINARRRAWRKRNKERLNDLHKIYRDKNSQKLSTIKRKSYIKKRDEVLNIEKLRIENQNFFFQNFPQNQFYVEPSKDIPFK